MTIRGVNQQRIDPPQSGLTWLWRQVGQLGQGTPSHQYDWPNPYPVQWYQSWSWRQVDKFGKDTLPNRQQDWPNPTPSYRIEQTTTVVHTQFTGLDTLPFRNLYPNPDPVQWYRSWEKSRQLTTVVTNPFFQTDWPLPSRLEWYRDWSWNQTNKLGLDTLPFNQKDYPNPVLPSKIEQTWIQNLAGNLLPPFRQSDWPLPQPAQWYKSFEGPKTSTVLNPFIQSDWPISQPVTWYRDWSSRYSLFGQDKLPNRQSDWPVPYPIQWYQDYKLNLLQSTLFAPPGKPFAQYDYPNPVGYPRLNDYSFINFAVNPPLPAPPVVTQGGGWTEWTEIDVQNQAAFWKKTAKLENYYQNIRTDAQELGRKGGEARMKTMTAFERQTYARKAAEARWGKK